MSENVRAWELEAESVRTNYDLLAPSEVNVH